MVLWTSGYVLTRSVSSCCSYIYPDIEAFGRENAATLNEIKQLKESGNDIELEKRLGSVNLKTFLEPFKTESDSNRIEFGTAGLRGKMEAGFSRMNGIPIPIALFPAFFILQTDLTIIQASQGLCRYILDNIHNSTTRGVVIGHDHRHNSSHWAELTAAVFISEGVKVYLLAGLVHTPMVPFSIKHLRACAGVMITASHNPKQDNGYKVYWENAVQIIAPHDEGIAKCIAENFEPRTWDVSGLKTSPLLVDQTAECIDEYFITLGNLCARREENRTATIKFVNTSMHGVSHPFVTRAFQQFGLAPFTPVQEQQDPDPEFPTVTFPNPEEKGALDLGIQTADRLGIAYVLAQDPDSDRFCAAEKSKDGKWTKFTGDQLGTIFGARILELYKLSGKPIENLALVASTVSSKMLEVMAKREGFKFVECLTGFKFIGNTALDLVAQGYEVPFGYEEAIGYMFGNDIRDKDGASATAIFAELAALLDAQGKTMSSFLTSLYDRYGYFETNNGYFICNEPSTIDAIFSRIRRYETTSHPSTRTYPSSIANILITQVTDLTKGCSWDSNREGGVPLLPLSSGHMIQFRAGQEGDERSPVRIVLTLRTSGTEPKIKYYLEGNGQNQKVVTRALKDVVKELGDKWLEANKHGLQHS
ncbi:hypothetical protein DL96DRAFT_1703152 [Flagelloscypha sp. PMI_526]|nr:hypothetical protein DL96DRAFT_1703152 [Flagelloscypha sp. PMI_526]